MALLAVTWFAADEEERTRLVKLKLRSPVFPLLYWVLGVALVVITLDHKQHRILSLLVPKRDGVIDPEPGLLSPAVVIHGRVDHPTILASDIELVTQRTGETSEENRQEEAETRVGRH